MEYVKGGKEKLDEANTSHVQLDEAIADVNTISSSPLHNSDQPLSLFSISTTIMNPSIRHDTMPLKGSASRQVTDCTLQVEVLRTTSNTDSSTGPYSSTTPTISLLEQVPTLPPIPVLLDPPIPAVPTPVSDDALGDVPCVQSIRKLSFRPCVGSHLNDCECRRTWGPIMSQHSEDVADKDGRLVIVWDPELHAPTNEHSSRFVLDIGDWVMDKCPMLYPSFDQGPSDLLERLLDALSVYYEFDKSNTNIRDFVQFKAMKAYLDWMTDCTLYVFHNWVGSPIPIEFEHRPDEWEWFLACRKTEMDRHYEDYEVTLHSCKRPTFDETIDDCLEMTRPLIHEVGTTFIVRHRANLTESKEVLNHPDEVIGKADAVCENCWIPFSVNEDITKMKCKCEFFYFHETCVPKMGNTCSTCLQQVEGIPLTLLQFQDLAVDGTSKQNEKKPRKFLRFK